MEKEEKGFNETRRGLIAFVLHSLAVRGGYMFICTKWMITMDSLRNLQRSKFGVGFMMGSPW